MSRQRKHGAGKRQPQYVPEWHERWPGAGVGRSVKRQLSKARRRQAKLELRFDDAVMHERALRNVETEANWKTH